MSRTPHAHSHSHAAHPPAPVLPSLLRLSASQRLAIAGALALLLWALVFWATV